MGQPHVASQSNDLGFIHGINIPEGRRGELLFLSIAFYRLAMQKTAANFELQSL
ncbi:hypothetical protein [Legionella micdadei]|uniref:Uncharacterized protein n=1 Tax=Legionella micdadei TaxID=451 RepID=A0A098GDA8_LEGMI|nr:hypothetical protein [Legionella micdadei]KTD29068.1 hypothetical protein Lmic_0988 [Legionella micdadei]CEG59431.1 protein of unknown function [Legionella micdadei]SCX89734.1 hypothetical protein SAMN02982997_00302 [Legionella micdadei]